VLFLRLLKMHILLVEIIISWVIHLFLLASLEVISVGMLYESNT